jgi:hypothetical protein
VTKCLSYYALTGQKVPLIKRLKRYGARTMALLLGKHFYTNYDLMVGKNIIIIGPADTATKYYSGDEIDAFDLVVRVNSSLDLVENFEGSIGCRTDVLYHNLKENGERSTGAIRLHALIEQKTRMIICPTPTDEKLAGIVKKKLKMWGAVKTFPELKSLRVRATPRPEFVDLCEMLGGFWPTTGLAGIYSLLQSQASRVTVTGFTFYTSGYSLGYKQSFTTLSEIKDWTDQNVVHKTSLEKDVFCDIILKARLAGKTVYLDPTLEGFVIDFEKRELRQ